MTIARDIEKLHEEIGELIARRSKGSALEEFARYRDDPVGFLEDVLGAELIDKQRDIAEAIRDHRQVVVRGCNGSGKDHTAARLALWWVYSRGGLALLSGPTERQVKEILMRREVRRAFNRAKNLPGELYELALRIPGHEESGILAFTATDPDKFTGHHSPGGVLVVLTEGQGIPDEIVEAALSTMTGEDSRIVVVGNPLRPVGKFFEVCTSPTWTQLKIAATDHPNVQTGREIVKGAITRAWVRQIADEYGEASPQYVARVLAEFPTESAEALIRREWIDDAVKAWHEQDRGGWSGRETFAVDVAHKGPDSTVLAKEQNRAVRELVQWRGLDTSESAGRIQTEAGGRRPTTVIDCTGLGWGTFDALKERGWPVVAFVAAQGAKDPERFANARAEAAWSLREALEARKLPLPPDPELREELLAVQWMLDPQGRTAIEPKDDTKARIRRSPDKYDAVAMLAWHLRPANRPAEIPAGALRLGNLEFERVSPWRIE